MPEQIDRAELHIMAWDGAGPGTVPDPLTLNDQALPTPQWQGRHALQYSIIPVDPALLRKGDNVIRILSDTEHHSIDILLPGPALMIRRKAAE